MFYNRQNMHALISINMLTSYFRNMPVIDTLMQEWPPEFEELLKEVDN